MQFLDPRQAVCGSLSSLDLIYTTADHCGVTWGEFFKWLINFRIQILSFRIRRRRRAECLGETEEPDDNDNDNSDGDDRGKSPRGPVSPPSVVVRVHCRRLWTLGRGHVSQRESGPGCLR